MDTKRIRWHCIACLLALCLLLTGAPAFAGTTYYVANNGDDINAGTDPAFPKQHIQAAINVSLSGDTVLVRDGVYTGTNNKNLDAHGRNIIVRSASGDPTHCIIDCQLLGRGFLFNTGETSAAAVDGFTVINGDPTLNTGYGGTWGGAIAVGLGCTPTITHCIFQDNRGINGAAIVCYQSSPTIMYCTFLHNSNRNGWGGGVDIFQGSPTITNCAFFGNRAAQGGGALHVNTSSSKITNCVFVGNRDAYGGNAIYVENASRPVFTNCTFTANGVDGLGKGIVIFSSSRVTINNSILWADRANEFQVDSSSSLLVTHSDVQGGWQGAGNISLDPLFGSNPGPGPDGVWGTSDDDFGDLRLQSGSPCVDTGDPATDLSLFPQNTEGVPTDIDNLPRIAGGIIDIGANELQSVNHSPIANAGASQTLTISHDGDPSTNTASFTLDGSASSDPDGDALTFAWSDANGASLGNTAGITLERPAGTYVFTLTVTDPSGASASDNVTVTINPEPNQAPLAEAGSDQTVEATGPTTNVTLNGSASSDPETDPLTYQWSEGATSLGTGQTLQIALSPGSHTITLTVTDPYGMSASDSVKVTITDTTPPTISGVPADIQATAASSSGAVVTFPLPTAFDLVDGNVPVTCSPASGSLFPLGKSMVTCSATDAAGNTATATFQIWVTYSWSGILQPINSDGSSVFKAGSTVPVKFQLTGASAGITNATATLSYAKISNGVPGEVNEAVSTSAATSGNLFRYDAGSRQYIFNWSTKGLSSGTYELHIDLGDGLIRTVRLGLK